jgi:hypothetical protein
MSDAKPQIPEDLLLIAAQNADWGQVVANGGPPCFHFQRDQMTFCLRAERWAGHGLVTAVGHAYVPLWQLIHEFAQAKQRIAALTAQVGRLSAPVSDEEKRKIIQQHSLSVFAGNSALIEAVNWVVKWRANPLLAARADKPQEGRK